jgi:PAS domain S-box-containing protein
MAEEDEEKTVRPAAQCGFEAGYLEGANISWGDSERGRGPIGIAVRTGITQINQDFLSNPLLALWRDAALTRGYRSSIALPLKAGGRTFAVLAIYSSVADSFNSEEVALLEELADDLAYGVSALRLRIAHDRAIEKLHKSAQEIEGLYNLAPCGYHSLDADGVVRSINDTELAWLGYARDEVVGKMRFTELISPAHIPDFHETFSQLKRQGVVRDVESVQMRKDGSLYSVLINATAVYDADGNYLTSRSTVIDISRRKQAEEMLRRNDLRLRALIRPTCAPASPRPGTVFGSRSISRAASRSPWL